MISSQAAWGFIYFFGLFLFYSFYRDLTASKLVSDSAGNQHTRLYRLYQLEQLFHFLRSPAVGSKIYQSLRNVHHVYWLRLGCVCTKIDGFKGTREFSGRMHKVLIPRHQMPSCHANKSV